MTRYLLLLGLSTCAFGAFAGEDVTFATIDANSDGFVSESEFVSWKTSAGDATAADALVKFIEIDADASGMISEAELEAAMTASEPDDSIESDHSRDQM